MDAERISAKRQIPPRSGQFGQGAAEPRGEPRDRVHAAVAPRGRRDAVEQNEDTALACRGKRRPPPSPRWGVRGCRVRWRVRYASGQSARCLHVPCTIGRLDRTSRSDGRPGRNSGSVHMRAGILPKPGPKFHPVVRAWPAAPWGDLFANSGVRFTPSGGGAVDARPPLKSTGMVRSRTGHTRAGVHVTVRHLCFKGGRVKIASTGAEEAASEQGQHARGAGGDASRQRVPPSEPCGYAVGSSPASPSWGSRSSPRAPRRPSAPPPISTSPSSWSRSPS